MTIFQPSASLDAIAQRAKILGVIRDYFRVHNVLEVEVPVLAEHSVTDVHLSALTVDLFGQQHFLQTSPEYYLKRLLASGSGSLYSLGKAFRADPNSPRHRAEFTMLEWYRIGFDDKALMNDVEQLLHAVGAQETVERIAYGEIFTEKTGLNPYTCSDQALADYCHQHFSAGWSNTPRSTWLDLIFSSHIEPSLQAPTLVYDFPACQCALSKLGSNAHNEPVAKRFELYWRGLELANGYWELTCPIEQQQRFEQDNQQRLTQGYAPIAIDPFFMAAIKSGLPECAGIALGVDRLMMCLLQAEDIADVITFG